MYMGVILHAGHKSIMVQRIPHVYGGDPHYIHGTQRGITYSPCIWG